MKKIGIGILSAVAIVGSASANSEKFLFHTGKNLEKTLAPSSEAGLVQVKSEFGVGMEDISTDKTGFVGYLGADYQFPITSDLDDNKISLSFGLDGSYALTESSKEAKAITASSEIRYGIDSDYGVGSRLSLGYGNIESHNLISSLSLYAGYSEQLFGMSGNVGIASTLSTDFNSDYDMDFLGFLAGKYAVPMDIDSAMIFSGMFAGGIDLSAKGNIVTSVGVSYQFNQMASLGLEYNLAATDITGNSSKIINILGLSLNMNFEM